jgi:beta-glucanase (GH16 family)
MKSKWIKGGSRVREYVCLALLLASSQLSYAGWQLTWSDEFNGSNVDTATWAFETGAGGWGNSEREFYTGGTTNTYVSGGALHIVAKQQSMGGVPYTSARMKSQGLYAKKYGRFEFRAKLPQGVGCWPALWMMGANIGSVGWPACGEMDVMENRGTSSNVVGGTLHYSDSSNNHLQQGLEYTLGTSVTNFHTYAVEWTTNSIKWLVDSNTIQTWTSWSSSTGPYPAPYNQPFFLLMNLAIGGNYLGNPSDAAINSGTQFPVELQVDYIRIYDFVPSIPDVPTGLRTSPGSGKVFLSWDDSSGATGYVVKRATSSGGPYTTVASPAVNNYTDTSLANCSTYYYVVSATNSLGASTNSSEQAASLGAFALAVNSGGNAAGQFAADAFVSGGTIGAMVPAMIDTTGLVAPAPQAVYQAERYGNFTYTFTGLISGVSYTVRLHSAETYWTDVGQRRFNLFINGAQVLTNFDILAVAGAPNKAVINEFNAVASGGQIVVQFVTVTDNARASGIEVILPRPAAPSGLTAIASDSQVALNWNALAGATYNVKRALDSGGPYVPIFSGLAGTNCVDAGVTNGVNYYYVVSAAILGCESANSAPVNATPPASVGIQYTDGNVILSWPGGTLQSATNIVGPWADVSGAASPLTNPAGASQEYYRLRLE